MKKIIFFDLDGTLKLRNKNISKRLLDFLFELNSYGFACTLITGKSFHWLKTCIGDDLNRLIFQNILLGVENGSKASDLNGNIFYAESFTDSQILKLSNFIENSINEIRLLSFAPATSLGRGSMYFFNFDNKKNYQKKYFKSYDFYEDDVSSFIKHFQIERPGMLNIKISNPLLAKNLAIDFDVSFNEGYLNINPKGVNKGFFVSHVAKYYNKSLNDVVVVGNDNNDFSMFALPVFKKIFVLNDSDKNFLPFSDLVFANEPDDLRRVIEGGL